MSTRIVIDDEGVTRVQAASDSVCMEKIVEPMADDMRTYVPVLTGDLKRTIRIYGPDILGPGHFQIWVGDVAGDVDYHLYVEFGTSKMDAQPYIRPAVYRVRSA
jgi:HK97 gp10 family phage protein